MIKVPSFPPLSNHPYPSILSSISPLTASTRDPFYFPGFWNYSRLYISNWTLRIPLWTFSLSKTICMIFILNLSIGVWWHHMWVHKRRHELIISMNPWTENTSTVGDKFQISMLVMVDCYWPHYSLDSTIIYSSWWFFDCNDYCQEGISKSYLPSSNSYILPTFSFLMLPKS